MSMYINVCFVKVIPNRFGYTIHLALDCCNITSNYLEISYYDSLAKEYVKSISINGGGSSYVTNAAGYMNITLSPLHSARYVWDWDMYKRSSGIVCYTFKIAEKGKQICDSRLRHHGSDSDWAMYFIVCRYLSADDEDIEWISVKIKQSNFETQTPRPRIGG